MQLTRDSFCTAVIIIAAHRTAQTLVLPCLHLLRESSNAGTTDAEQSLLLLNIMKGQTLQCTFDSYDGCVLRVDPPGPSELALLFPRGAERPQKPSQLCHRV